MIVLLPNLYLRPPLRQILEYMHVQALLFSYGESGVVLFCYERKSKTLDPSPTFVIGDPAYMAGDDKEMS